jgi:Transposase DDE domain group 1
MAAGDNPRFVVTSLEAPTPQHVYADLYCARGNGANDRKAVKCDLHSDRTSATTCLANAVRLLLSCGASVLHQALRTHTLAHTALATAQPSTVILTLFKVATQVKQYKDRMLLHLPTSCPVKATSRLAIRRSPQAATIRPRGGYLPPAVVDAIHGAAVDTRE